MSGGEGEGMLCYVMLGRRVGRRCRTTYRHTCGCGEAKEYSADGREEECIFKHTCCTCKRHTCGCCQAIYLGAYSGEGKMESKRSKKRLVTRVTRFVRDCDGRTFSCVQGCNVIKYDMEIESEEVECWLGNWF